MYMMGLYISLPGFIKRTACFVKGETIMQSSEAQLTSVISSRLTMCNAFHMCPYCSLWDWKFPTFKGWIRCIPTYVYSYICLAWVIMVRYSPKPDMHKLITQVGIHLIQPFRCYYKSVLKSEFHGSHRPLHQSQTSDHSVLSF